MTGEGSSILSGSKFYSSHLFVSVVEEEEKGSSEEEELGGLFRVSRPEKSKKLRADAMDCSRFQPDASHDWDQEEVSNMSSTLNINLYLSALTVNFLNISEMFWRLNQAHICNDACFQMLASIRDCFVTGKWEGDKDAATLLKADGKAIINLFSYKKLCLWALF